MTRPLARVLALLDILQAGGTHTAAGLAARLEVDERTARRYVAHLLDLDVPVRATRGRHGGFQLAPGYRMPPLMLTDDEALAVLAGLTTGPAAESASAKIRRVLPKRLAARLAALPAVTPSRSATRAPEAGILLTVAEAARDSKAVKISYQAADGHRSERTLHPYGVAAHAGRWYVTAADSASGEDRTFRVDRIHTISVLTETFEPAERDLLTALAEAPRRYAVSVLVRATREHLDRRVPRGLATVEPADDRLRLRLQVEELDWVPALLAWIDRPFEIEEPAELRAHVRALSERLARAALPRP